MEDGVYMADENCKENLDSIYDMVQKDDNSGSYRQQVGSAGIFSSDLIPLLGQKIDDEEIFDSLIRLGFENSELRKSKFLFFFDKF